MPKSSRDDTRSGYARIYALSQLVTMLGYAGGPELAGALFDHFGGCREAFLALTIAGVLRLVAFLAAG